MNTITKAKRLLREFKGDAYTYGRGAIDSISGAFAECGKRAVLVASSFAGIDSYISSLKAELGKLDIELVGEVAGPAPNAPLEDLFRISDELKKRKPEFIISFGGGSTIDVTKAADVLQVLGGEIEEYFGVGNVTAKCEELGKKLSVHLAIQTSASSGAHLTKYSNITNTETGQKKLIVDEAIVPSHPVFDFSITDNAPKELTMDGALDGIAHCLEVLYGAVNAPNYEKIREVAETGISLVVENLGKVIDNPGDGEAREALCLATDMGGYAIMIGGTNGGHLTSFSLVDVLSHGRACAMMNPYYTVFFAPAIEDPLRAVGSIYKNAGYTDADLDALSGRDLGVAVAEAMLSMSEKIGFPTKLSQVAGFSDAHISRALAAAKNPQLKMKLQNMPIPLTAEQIDEYMGPILEGARDGDLSLIKNR